MPVVFPQEVQPVFYVMEDAKKVFEQVRILLPTLTNEEVFTFFLELKMFTGDLLHDRQSNAEKAAKGIAEFSKENNF